MSEHYEEVLGYCNDIKTGKILSGFFTKKAIERFVKDIKSQNDDGFLYRLDTEAADAVIDFAESLVIPDIPGNDKHLRLLPWMKFIYYNIWGWVYKAEPDRRRFRQAYIEVARKNSKTTSILFPFILYDWLTSDSAESYFISKSEKQASAAYDELCHIIDEDEQLKAIANKTVSAITYKTSRITFFPSDAHGIDAYKNSMTVADEYHAYDISGAKIITAFRYGGRARKNNTVVIITSAGIDINSPCHEENLKAKKVLNGVINDDSYFSIIYSYDEEDSWKDKSLFIKANPSLGPILRQDILEGDLADAIATPSHQADFVAKTCGIWQQGAKSWIPLQRIEQNKDVVINPEMLTGKICTGALDLSSVNDFTVFSLCFKLSTGKYTFLHKMYIPADTLADRYAHENINFKQWIDTGLITVIPGATVDYDWVYEDIKKAYQKYRIHELSYDRWHSNEIIKKIDEEFGELPLVPLDQSLKNMSPITKSYEKEFLDGNIIENNPVTVWHLGNVVVKPTAAGDYKPLKVNAQSNQRIDSVITSIMSLSRYKVLAGKAQPARSFDEILNSF